jgi:hypothetical protein
MSRRRIVSWSRSGSISVEFAILLPAFMFLIGTALYFGQIAGTQTTINLAARDAARAASLDRNAPAANQAAEDAAEAVLSSASITCENGKPYATPTKTPAPLGQPSKPPTPPPTPPPGKSPPPTPPPPKPTPSSAFDIPVGQAAYVTYVVTCKIQGGFLDGKTLQATFTSPLDTYRGRS